MAFSNDIFVLILLLLSISLLNSKQPYFGGVEFNNNCSVYVSSTNGSDTNSGSKENPLKTIQKAILV